MSRLALTLAALLALPAPASADLVASPPSSCPRGAIGRSVPSTGWCEPTTCTADSDCESGQVCSAEEIGLCVYEESVATERVPYGEHREVPTRTVRMVRDRGCEPDGTCLNMQSTCERTRRCVAAAPAPAPTIAPTPPATVGPAPAQADEPAAAADTSGGCSVGASGSPWIGSVALLALVALGRRRAHSRSAQREST